MKILVLSAMDIETESMRKALVEFGYSLGEDNIYENESHLIKLATVGIGKVNSAVNTYAQLMKGTYLGGFDIVISQGCCAGVSGLVVGDVFLVDSAYQYDFTLEPVGYHKAEIPMSDGRTLGFFSCVKTAKYPIKNFRLGTMLTADKFCLGTEEFDDLPVLGQIVGADMETAAIFQSCKLFGDIPFLGIRSVSDVVGSSTQAEDYQENEKRACSNAANSVMIFIEKDINKVVK